MAVLAVALGWLVMPDLAVLPPLREFLSVLGS